MLKFLVSRKKTLLTALSLLCLTFLLRWPTFFRPFDRAYEIQLAFFGRQAFAGGGFYSTPWSMKPPGETMVYGLTYLVFGFKNWVLAVRLTTAVLAGVASVAIFFLGKKFYGFFAGLSASLFFIGYFSRSDVFLGALSYAEMLVPLFTVSGVFFFLNYQKDKARKSLIISGTALGFSLLFKQSAVYDFLPLVLYGMGKSYLQAKKIWPVLREYSFFVLSFLAPLGIFIGYIFLIGKISYLWDWMVVKPGLYSRLREREIGLYLGSIFGKAYFVWILACFSIFSAFFKKDKVRTILVIWFFSTFLSFITSGKLWNYYFIQPFLPACLLAGILVYDVLFSKKKKYGLALFFLIIAVFWQINFRYYSGLYQRFWRLLTGKTTLEEYTFSLSDGEAWIDIYQAANFLKPRLGGEKKLLVLEGTPTFYVLADQRPYFNYVFDQQFFENKTIGFAFNHRFQSVSGNRQDLADKLLHQSPEYVVLVMNSPADALDKVVSFPWFFTFVFKNYRLLNNFGDVWVYEKNKEVLPPDKLLLDSVFAKKYSIIIKEK